MKRRPRFLTRAQAAARAAAVRSAAPMAGLSLLSTPMTTAGIYVTPEIAENYSAVFSAINIISTDCATLPTKLYRKLPGNARELVADDDVADLLQVEWSAEVDAIHGMKAWFGDALRTGDGIAEIVRERSGVRDGLPVELHRIAPSDVKVERNDKGRLVYTLSNGKVLLPADVLHLKGPSRDGLVGQSVVELARQTIGTGIAAETTAGSMFGNGPNMPGFLKTEKNLKEGAQERIEQHFSDKYSGPFNAGKPGILVGDWTWVQMGISPQDGQFLATRAFNVVEICRWFNINPIKLMDFTNGRFNNIEQAQFDHVQTTLLPWLVFAEIELNRKLLTPDQRRQYEIRHDLDERMRADSVARWNNYTRGFQIGCLNQNEIRAKEGLNPIEGGDIYYIQVSNLGPVGPGGAKPIGSDAGADAAGDAPAEEPAPEARDAAPPAVRIPRGDAGRIDTITDIYLEAVTI